MIVNHPDDRTAFLNKNAIFTCLTQPSSTPHWRVNDTDYVNNTIPNELNDDLSITSEPTTHFNVLTLNITARTEYNETRFECVAGDVVSDTATLYIQGMNIICSRF